MKNTLTIFLLILTFTKAIGQQDSIISDIPFGKWKELAYFNYRPAIPKVDSSEGYSISDGINGFNSFKRMNGWREVSLEINPDNSIIESLVLSRNKTDVLAESKFTFTDGQIFAQYDTMEVLYYRDNVLVISSDGDDFTVYIPWKKNKKDLKIPEYFIVPIIRRRLGLSH